jgi:N-acetylneuraminic acid mutarotase
VSSPSGPCCLSYVHDLDARTPDDIWAVGESGGGPDQPIFTLTMHWDGSSWNYIESPNVGTHDNILRGVSVVAANDVWAVGYIFDHYTGYSQTLVMHWDGIEWNVVSSPNPGNYINKVQAIAAVSPNDIWAVGITNYQLLALHWNGSQWSVVPTPSLSGQYINLGGITAIAANDIWAAGSYEVNYYFVTLTIHWNGTQWSVVPSPNIAQTSNRLGGISGVAANDIWAVGSYSVFVPYETFRTLTLHWDGTQWSIVPSPNASNTSPLYDVSAISANDVWAVGDYGGPTWTLTMHWDGSAWNIVPSPNANTQSNVLSRVVAISPGEVWAAGYFYYFDDSNAWEPLVEHYLDPCAPPTSTPTGTPPTSTPTHTPTPPPPCSAGIWDSQTPYPIPIMDEAIATQGGIMYSFSGVSNGPVTAASYKYDPTSNSWSSIAPLPGERENASAVSDGTYIYILGGWDGNGITQGTMFRYDPATDSYTTMSSFTIATAAQGAAYVNGKIYRIGGCTDTCDNFTGSVEAFDIANNTWTTVAPLPQALAWFMVTAQGNYLYTAGGIRPPETGKTYRYDPSANTWSDAAISDLPSVWWGGASSVLNDKSIIAGGYAGFQFSDSVAGLDMANPTGTWLTLTPMPAARSRMDSGTLGNALYVVGGRPAPDGFTGSVDNFRYRELPCTTPTATSIPTLSPTPTITPPTTPTTPIPTTTSMLSSTPTSSGTPTSNPTRTSTPLTSTPRTSTPTPALTITVAATTATTTATSAGSAIPSGTVTATFTAVAPPTVCIAQFEDMPAGSTFYSFVHCLACRGIVSGYLCGNPEPCVPPGNLPYFRPNANVTRGQIAKIVSNAAGFTEPHTEQSFQDVPPTHTFFIYIARLASRSIINGYLCGGSAEPCVPPENRPYFRPANNTTRGQLSKIVCQAFGCVGSVSGQTFQDVSPDNTFYADIEHLYALRAINGYPCGNPDPCIPPLNRPYFRPGANITRGQTSKVVANTFFPNCQAP